MCSIIGVCLCLLLAIAYAVKLPAYIKTCDKTAKDFKQCSLRNGKDALPHLVKGDRKLKIPPLNPLRLPEIFLSPSSGFSLKLTDVTIDGLEDPNLKNVNFDLNNNRLSVELYVDHLIITGQYDINGRLLIPLTGTGPANITVYGVNVLYEADFDTVRRKDDEYMALKKDRVTYTRDNVHFLFDNLLGNKEISDGANRILNENAKEVGGELHAVVAETIRSIVNQVIVNVLTAVPLKEIFP